MEAVPSSLVEHLIGVRQHLHQHPELSSAEEKTAQFVEEFIRKHSSPTAVASSVGGRGVVASYDSGVPGKSILFRAELDALPIQEVNSFSHKSIVDGVSHKCGHDGHCATLLGLAMVLGEKKLLKGKVYLVFQPAEETGVGAEGILSDKYYQANVDPDVVYAFHNVPGYPLGQIILRKGAFTASVRSVKFCIHGKPSHAAEPENGINPSLPIAKILLELDKLSNNAVDSDKFRVITPVHVKIGEVAYGVSAGYGELHLTIRTWTEAEMKKLVEDIIKSVSDNTKLSNMTFTEHWTDVFRANENTDEDVEILEKCCALNGYEIHHSPHPMKWGEDFGAFTQCHAGSFFGIGSGETHASLHNDDYDYPDELLPIGLNMFLGVLHVNQMIT